MTHANLVSRRRSGFSPTFSLTKGELFDSEKPSPRGGGGMSEAMDGRGQAHRDVLAAVPPSSLGQGLRLNERSQTATAVVGLKPDLQERPCRGDGHGS